MGGDGQGGILMVGHNTLGEEGTHRAIDENLLPAEEDQFDRPVSVGCQEDSADMRINCS